MDIFGTVGCNFCMIRKQWRKGEVLLAVNISELCKEKKQIFTFRELNWNQQMFEVSALKMTETID